MGNQPPVGDTAHNKTESWLVLSKKPSYSVLHNPNTREQCEKYDRLYSNLQEYQKDLYKYQQRMQQFADNVVRIQSVDCVKKEEMCTTFYRLGVYVEHLPYTMDRIENMNFRQSLYVLIEVLTAVRYLIKLYPKFIIDQTRIFINRQGYIKVWISENPADNELTESQLYSLQDVQNEGDIVQIVFDIVESRTLPSQLPLDFLKKVRFSTMGFDETISHIKVYCFDRRIKMAQSLEDCLMKECPSERCNTKLTNFSASTVLRDLNSNFSGGESHKPVSMSSNAGHDFQELYTSKKKKVGWVSDACTDVGCKFLRQ